MRVFSADTNNDLYIGPGGSMAISTELQAVMQAAQQAAQAQLGEMIYAVDQGVPNFGTVWNGAPNIPQFEAYLRRTLLSVEGVTGIESLSVSSSGNKLSYVVTINTIYGRGAMNG